MEKKDIKWIEQMLGISRRTIEHYEDTKVNLLQKRDGRLQKKLYTEDEIKWLWIVKTFIKMGYSIEDMKKYKEALMNDEASNLLDSLKEKIIKLGEDIKEQENLLRALKTFESTGRVPIVKKIGKMKFNDFIGIVTKKYSINQDEYDVINFLEGFDKINVETLKEEELDNVNKTLSILTTVRITTAIELCYRELESLKKLSPTDELIQKQIAVSYDFIKTLPSYNTSILNDKKSFSIVYSPLYSEKQYQLYLQLFEEETMLFINKAFSVFGEREEFEGIINEMTVEEEK